MRERTVLKLLFCGLDACAIADQLEQHLNTVNLRLRVCCAKAGVRNRYELLVFIAQQPQCLVKGGRCVRGIHPYRLGCPCLHCQAQKPDGGGGRCATAAAGAMETELGYRSARDALDVRFSQLSGNALPPGALARMQALLPIV